MTFLEKKTLERQTGARAGDDARDRDGVRARDWRASIGAGDDDGVARVGSDGWERGGRARGRGEGREGRRCAGRCAGRRAGEGGTRETARWGAGVGSREF